jgi:DNA-binding CsgD family transcriptional regulator
VPYTPAWRPTPPGGLSERAQAAWMRSDWQTVSDELVEAAVTSGDAAFLVPLIENEAQMLDPSYLLAHGDALRDMPPDPITDAALAYLAVRDGAPGCDVRPALAGAMALTVEHPRVAASVALAVGLILGDRGRLAEADQFLQVAREAVRRVRADSPDAAGDELWFEVMALAVLLEWDTHGGDSALQELSAALTVPRARNLLRAHHAAALVASGYVLAARGEFGSGAVGIARGAALLPQQSAAWASAQARLALVKYRQGDWRAARQAVHAVTAAPLDDAWSRVLVMALSALEPALAGDLVDARERIAIAQKAVAASPSVQAETLLLHARVAYAIGANDWNLMVQVLEDAGEPGFRRIYTDHEWRALWGMALRNAGRAERYRALVEEWARQPDAAQHAYYWAHVALLAHGDGDHPKALAAALRARERVSDREDPLGRTWVRIVVGTLTSLLGDPTEGMESYEAARAELSEMGAGGFVRLCTRVIEGTAAELARVSGDPLGALTAQQRRVAELVAEGYTSAEIGQILYLSKKTIDFHVANIVSRLGLSSRRELARRLAPG